MGLASLDVLDTLLLTAGSLIRFRGRRQRADIDRNDVCHLFHSFSDELVSPQTEGIVAASE